MNCFCDGVAYSPVCCVKTGTTFFSPCHAACNRWDNEKKVYSGCSCAAKSLHSNGNVSTILLKSTFRRDEDLIPTTTSTTLIATSPNPTSSKPTTFSTETSDFTIYAKMSQYEDDDAQQQTGRRKRKADIFENVMTPGIHFDHLDPFPM